MLVAKIRKALRFASNVIYLLLPLLSLTTAQAQYIDTTWKVIGYKGELWFLEEDELHEKTQEFNKGFADGFFYSCDYEGQSATYQSYKINEILNNKEFSIIKKYNVIEYILNNKNAKKLDNNVFVHRITCNGKNKQNRRTIYPFITIEGSDKAIYIYEGAAIIFKDAVNNIPRPSNKSLWKINNAIVSPRCFSFEWYSGDNWEALAAHYGIKDLEKLSESPGAFIGTKIKDFEGIQNPWPVFSAHPRENIYIARPTRTCEGDKLKIEQDSVVTVRLKTDIGFTEIRYSKHNDLSPDFCKLLAPNFNKQCSKAGIYKIGDWQGGSRGFSWQTYIYGLFPHDGNSHLVIPLKKWFGNAVYEAQVFAIECEKKKYKNCH